MVEDRPCTAAQKIGAAYKDMDLTMTTLPADDVAFDPQSFREAIKLMDKGDVVTIFTPDDTHFEITLACIEAGQGVRVQDFLGFRPASVSHTHTRTHAHTHTRTHTFHRT